MIRGLFVILAIFIASRAMIRSLPGDPLDTLIAETGTTLPRQEIQRALGLDLPFWSSLRHDIQSGLGSSVISGEPVFRSLLTKLGYTLALSSAALTVSICIALLLSLTAAGHAQLQGLILSFARLTVLLPTAWIGPLLLYAFAVLVPWVEFRSSGILACITLALPITGSWIRLLHLRIQEEMHEPYFRVALSKGLPFRRALTQHALAPALGALLALLGSQWGALLAGTFVVEFIFDWPGLGTAWIQAVLQRDYPMIEGATFLGATTCVLGMALGDALQRWWDPRLAHSEEQK